jgi:hypothetical protein
MFTCPHCGKELDVSPRPQVPWWKYDPGPGANLGCGTLILIILIVGLFSSRETQSVGQVEQDVQSLHMKVDRLLDAVGKVVRIEQRHDAQEKAKQKKSDDRPQQKKSDTPD